MVRGTAATLVGAAITCSTIMGFFLVDGAVVATVVDVTGTGLSNIGDFQGVVTMRGM